MPLFDGVRPFPAYLYQVVKAAGVVAANQFISAFNPVNSGVAMLGLELSVDTFAAGSTSATDPLVGFRTSSQSGGTLIAASTIARFAPTFPDPQIEIRTGATVATTGLAVSTVAPVISVGTGNSGKSVGTPPGVFAVIPPGTGVTFGTASGAVNQIWDIRLVWGELS